MPGLLLMPVSACHERQNGALCPVCHDALIGWEFIWGRDRGRNEGEAGGGVSETRGDKVHGVVQGDEDNDEDNDVSERDERALMSYHPADLPDVLPLFVSTVFSRQSDFIFHTHELVALLQTSDTRRTAARIIFRLSAPLFTALPPSALTRTPINPSTQPSVPPSIPSFYFVKLPDLFFCPFIVFGLATHFSIPLGSLFFENPSVTDTEAGDSQDRPNGAENGATVNSPLISHQG